MIPNSLSYNAIKANWNYHQLIFIIFGKERSIIKNMGLTRTLISENPAST